MIKIDLVKKLDALDVKISDFEKSYVGKLLQSNYSVVSSKTVNNLEEFSDRYELNLGPNLEQYKNTKYKLPQLFYELYCLYDFLKDFIDETFDLELENETDAKDLLKKIILMSPDDIKVYISTLEINLSEALKEKLNIIFNYERNNKSIIRPKFEELDFRVCIYCNRNFISNFRVNKKKRATFTLDHFYQKDKYPIFALSLYNLIPSCAVCNTNVKNTRNVEQYDNPYSKNYYFHNLAKFKLMPNYKTKLVSFDFTCKKYIEDFYINAIYETHDKDVKQFVEKRTIYTDDLIKKLATFTNQKETDIKAHIFGEVIYADILDTEPLGKLKVDLAVEFGIVDKI